MDDASLIALYSAFAVDQENAPQWRGFLAHRLVMARCRDCRHWMNPPVPMCPDCWSEHIGFEDISGRAKVQWFSLLYPHAARPEQVAYPAVVVEFEEQGQLRMVTTIVDCDPSDIQCDMEVEVTWINIDGAPVPAFRPLAAPGSLTGDRSCARVRTADDPLPMISRATPRPGPMAAGAPGERLELST